MGDVEMIEPVPVSEIFCSGLGKIEKIGGGCVRLYLYVLQEPLGGGPPEKVLVQKIILPASAVRDVLRMAAADPRAERIAAH